MDQSLRVGIFIPTKNKPEFVIRQLRYYAALQSQHPVYIGDSSDPTDEQRLRSAVHELQGRLAVTYYHYPSAQYTYAQCVQDLVKSVKEPYAVFSGDDDFQIPHTLTQCAQFLETNPEYATAHGQAAILQLYKSAPYGRVKSVGVYLQGEINKETAATRLLQYLEHYFVLIFSVHRTRDVIHNWGMVDRLREHTFAAELLPFCLSSIEGKSKTLPGLSFIRQLHDSRYQLPDIFDWITNPNWALAYQLFRDQLVDEVVKKDHITPGEAQEVIKHAFWAYLKKPMEVKFQQRYGNPQAIVGIKAALKRIYGIKSAWQLIQSMRVSSEHISLPSLLNPRSPYHEDFMPIFRSITLPSNTI